jgi:putative modified peptide
MVSESHFAHAPDKDRSAGRQSRSSTAGTRRVGPGVSAAEADRAARLLERLLTDAEFRARFRRDPAATCRQAGLDDIADEMALGAGKAMMTLDVRESKSSLAGVMMAAAMEGAGLYQLSANVFPRLDDVPAAVGDVLSRVDLPSVRGALAAEPPATGATAVGAAEPSATGATAVGAAEPSATGATAVGPAEPSATGETAEAPPAQEAAGRATAGDTSQVGERGAGRGGSAIDEQAQAPRGADDLPDAPVEPRRPEGAKRGEEPASARAEPSDAETAPAPARTQPQAAAAETAPTSGASGEPRPDPDQYGMAGGGGEASAQARAVLANDRIQLDANGREDFAKGRMDPRVATILLELAEEHTVTVSSTTSDHPQNTSGGSVSNHWFGRGLDIATIDGEPVNAGSTAARKVASQLAELHQSIRPTEVGTPWAIAAPGFFTDAGHQDHIHLAFDDPIAADWTPPDGPPVTPESPTSPATADPSSGAAAAPSPLPRRRRCRVGRATR